MKSDVVDKFSNQYKKILLLDVISVSVVNYMEEVSVRLRLSYSDTLGTTGLAIRVIYLSCVQFLVRMLLH